MSELSEFKKQYGSRADAILRERAFAKSKGLTERGTRLTAGKKTWSDSVAQGLRPGGRGVGVQRVTGYDVGKAKGNVDKARAKATKTGKILVGRPAGGAKPTGKTVSNLKRSLKGRLATAKKNGTPLRPRRK